MSKLKTALLFAICSLHFAVPALAAWTTDLTPPGTTIGPVSGSGCIIASATCPSGSATAPITCFDGTSGSGCLKIYSAITDSSTPPPTTNLPEYNILTVSISGTNQIKYVHGFSLDGAGNREASPITFGVTFVSPPQPTVTLPSCTSSSNPNSGYSISWINNAIPVTKLQISTSSNFASIYEKTVSVSPTDATGFSGTGSTSGTLTFTAGTTYYLRAYDGYNYSTNRSFTTPASCCSSNIGQACTKTSSPNACGQTSTTSGTYQCDGSCSASAPSTPPNSCSYNLTINKSGTGSGTVTGTGINCGSTCSSSYIYGTSVNLSASPSSDSDFISWSGDCNSSGQVTMNGNKSCTAIFNLLPRCTTTTDPWSTCTLNPGSTNTCSNNGTQSRLLNGPAPCTQVPDSRSCDIPTNCSPGNTCVSGSCIPLPTVDLKVNSQDSPSSSPVTINNNTSASLTWTTTNSPSSCSASGSWTGDPGHEATNSRSTGNLTAGTYTYSIYCTNAAGNSTTDSATVRVLDNCTTTTENWGTCNLNANSNNTCSNNGTQSRTLNGPAPCTQIPESRTCDVPTNCSQGNTCDTGNCVPNLSASCSVTPIAARTGENVTWTATASGGTGTYTYSWSGDVSGATSSVITSYSTTGTKTGFVTVTSGSQTTNLQCTNSATITIPSPGTFTLNPPSTPTCSVSSPLPSSVNLSWTASSNAASYDIYRDGTAASNKIGSTTQTTYPDINIDNNSTHNYSVKAINSSGSTDSTPPTTTNITAPDCRPDLIVQNPAVTGTLLVGQTLTLSGTVKNQGVSQAAASTTQFKIDGVQIPDGAITTGTIAVNGIEAKETAWTAVAGDHTLDVCADSTNVVDESSEANNCSSTTTPVNFHVNQPPTCTLINGPATLNTSQAGPYNATAGDPDPGDTITYSWSSTPAGGTFTSTTSQTTNWSAATPGTYSLNLTVTDNYGVTATCPTKTVSTDWPPLTVSCFADPITVVNSADVRWTATAAGGNGTYNSYTWAGDAPLAGKTGNPVVVNYNSVGTKSGSVTIRDSAGNQGSNNCSVNVTVDYPAPPQPNFLSGSPETACSGVDAPYIDLSWQVSEPQWVQSYTIQRSDGVTIPGWTGTLYRDTNVQSGAGYFYRIIAVNTTSQTSGPESSIVSALNCARPDAELFVNSVGATTNHESATIEANTEANLSWISTNADQCEGSTTPPPPYSGPWLGIKNSVNNPSPGEKTGRLSYPPDPPHSYIFNLACTNTNLDESIPERTDRDAVTVYIKEPIPPFIQTTGGDVHTQQQINTPGRQ